MRTALALIDSWIASDADVAARRASIRVVPLAAPAAAPVAPVPAPVAPSAPAAPAALRFLWNGIKGPSGKLQGCWYSWSDEFHYRDEHRPAHITIFHNSHCGSFTGEVREALAGEIVNRTDSQSDYFDNDSITIGLGHPLFRAVAVATIAQEDHRARQADKMAARHPGRQNGDCYRKTAATLRAHGGA